MSSKHKTLEEIFRPSGEIELIKNRAQWALEARWRARPGLGFKTHEQEVNHQVEILDALCLNYLEARGKL